MTNINSQWTTMDNKEKEFEKMVHNHKEVIYTTCYMFSKDEEEVADLFQETLINMWKGVSKDNNSIIQKELDAQKAWIYRVALNTCISWNRKNKNNNAISLTMDIDLFADKDSSSRQANMLHQRICSLKPFDRAIILLWLEDMSYEEIGNILGLTAKNISVRLVRIREELKKNNKH